MTPVAHGRCESCHALNTPGWRVCPDCGHDRMADADPSTSVEIARCPEHGLHGERSTCFVCDGPVEQVRMYPAEMWEEACRSALIWKKRAEDLEDAICDYELWEPGRKGHAAAHRRLMEALDRPQTDEEYDERDGHA